MRILVIWNKSKMFVYVKVEKCCLKRLWDKTKKSHKMENEEVVKSFLVSEIKRRFLGSLLLKFNWKYTWKKLKKRVWTSEIFIDAVLAYFQRVVRAINDEHTHAFLRVFIFEKIFKSNS